MGLFDILKRNRNNEKFDTQLPYTIEKDFEGKTKIEYVEKMQNNDAYHTILTIIKSDGNLADCYVFWYKDGNAIMIDSTTGREVGTEIISTKIDFDLLNRDPNYVHALMCNLLNRDRVMKYLQRGLQENPENPCGKYVGSIEKREDGYKKVFDPNIGLMSHNSYEMVAERQRVKDSKIRNMRKELKVENNNAARALSRAQEIQKKLDEVERGR